MGAGRINAILCGRRLRSMVVLLVSVRCAGPDFGMGMHWVIGRGAMGAAVVQTEPCRIMACSPGRAVLMVGAREAGTSGRRSR